MKSNVGTSRNALRVRKIALCGMFTALAVAISFAENLSGINSLMPVPGVKLGLANIAVIGALLCTGGIGAFAVMLMRCLITFLCFGNAVGFFISLSGGALSVTAVCTVLRTGLFRKMGGFCSLIGVSAASAFFHAAGQLIAAALSIGNSAVLTAAPIICALSVITGIVTGIAANAVYRVLSGTGIADNYISLD